MFLDIDGVIFSECRKHENGSHIVYPDCVARLNQIIKATDPLIVISSSWRKIVLRGHMNLTGFTYMLMSHGVDCRGRAVGTTESDGCANSRGELIGQWLAKNAPRGRYRFVILDDGQYWVRGGEDHGIKTAGYESNFVHTNYWEGLTDRDVIKAIAILNGKTQKRKCYT